MSKYWEKMLILKEPISSNSIFISQERPSFFVSKDLYDLINSFDHKIDKKRIKKLNNIYESFFTVYNDQKMLNLTKTIENILDLDGLIINIERKGKIIGCVMSVFTPVKINDFKEDLLINASERFNSLMETETDLMFGCCSYLVLKKKYRNKGLGMALIQESLQVFYDNGGLGAYFINTTSRCINSIPVCTWELNLSNINIINLGVDIIKINQNNAEISRIYHKEYLKDKSLFFNPSLEYWKKWVNVFPTYMVQSSGKIIGLFSIKTYKTQPYRSNTIYNNCSTLICIGEQPFILDCMIQTCKHQYDILSIKEIGDVKQKDLIKIGAQKKFRNFINFFNITKKYYLKDFYLPLF